ncbi:unnamed protein product [Rotaria sp. Silwood1]|nr:unnamed protein product [Rotaria sp. Silwood1]CAF3682749.1 unnamed protein product [Rotaria sp. Silwood1]CAF3692959.1 unnamed protein product [Rotaria sp. Silwood1]CAF3725735.1 unnamed protein product [Rotaria sp. Silwood1]CAF4691567.1 unnamed protein product [Rotaria sp. Silwood1]
MSSTTATNTYLKPDYLQPLNNTSFSSSSTLYDSSQSPLALLAQTCSSIGKDSPSPPLSSSSCLSLNTSLLPNTAPPIITSLVTKSSSTLSSSTTSNNEKPLLSSKRSSPIQSNSTITNNKKSTVPVKPSTIIPSSSFVESNPLSSHLPTLFDPTTTAAALLLRSSLAYLAAQQQQQQQQQYHSFSTPCTVPGCLQCETVRHILAASVHTQPYICHWYSCNAKFTSADELIEHLRHNHTSTGKTTSMHQHHNHHRFHPYLKPPSMLNNNDQLPFFYPHLSLSPMTGTTRRTNNNTNNNN